MAWLLFFTLCVGVPALAVRGTGRRAHYGAALAVSVILALFFLSGVLFTPHAPPPGSRASDEDWRAAEALISGAMITSSGLAIGALLGTILFKGRPPHGQQEQA